MLRALFRCVVLVAVTGAYQPASPWSLQTSTRAPASPIMKKGAGRMGKMPGKSRQQQRVMGGFSKDTKSRLEKKDFQRDEWTPVAAKGELGAEMGSTMAVEAGMSPQGQNYIWTLVRGDDGDGEGSTVYATDGSCRACQFPTTNVKVSKETGEMTMECGSCGTKHSLETGEPVDWLPGNNPIQWAAQQLNKAKQPEKINLMKTRVSKACRVYVRLPDGTLKAAKTAAQRADELARFGASTDETEN